MTVIPDLPFASELRRIRSRLLRWYAKNQRDLPWRRTRDPYRIWVSEIMLQQTRVAAVLSYYARFIENFPTIRALAAASESDVLAAWSGLGYYRRAGAMHLCAQTLVNEHKGILPRDPAELCKLPGIGRYTSAAIASIAFDHASAVVDGNVERVLGRLFAVPTSTRAVFQSLAHSILDPRRPGDWNQAMMELGATVCTPKQPLCGECPLRPSCRLPGANTSRPKPARQRISVTFGFACRTRRIKLVQRPASATLMPGMWELPRVESVSGERVVARHKHSITVTDYDVTVVELRRSPREGVWTELSRLPALPLTGLTRKILRHMALLSPHSGPSKRVNESNDVSS